MVNRGYSVDQFDTIKTAYRMETTPLQKASYHVYLIESAKHDMEHFRSLLDAGLSPNPCNVYGESLLHTMAAACVFLCVRLQPTVTEPCAPSYPAAVLPSGTVPHWHRPSLADRPAGVAATPLGVQAAGEDGRPVDQPAVRRVPALAGRRVSEPADVRAVLGGGRAAGGGVRVKTVCCLSCSETANPGNCV